MESMLIFHLYKNEALLYTQGLKFHRQAGLVVSPIHTNCFSSCFIVPFSSLSVTQI